MDHAHGAPVAVMVLCSCTPSAEDLSLCNNNGGEDITITYAHLRGTCSLAFVHAARVHDSGRVVGGWVGRWWVYVRA